MKKIHLVAVILILVLILASAIFFVYMNENKRSLETQTNNDGAVSIGVTPKFSSEITFEIALNTHSGELSANLTQAIMLEDENGRKYKPLRWEGDPPGGHHRSGTLVFGSITPLPKTLKLVIQNIGGIAQREFLWTARP